MIGWGGTLKTIWRNVQDSLYENIGHVVWINFHVQHDETDPNYDSFFDESIDSTDPENIAGERPAALMVTGIFHKIGRAHV